MDPDAFSACMIKWDPRTTTSTAPPPPSRLLTSALSVPLPLPPPHTSVPPPGTSSLCRPATALGSMEEFFQAYGVRYYTVAKMAELGFTVSTLLDMKDEEIDDMMTSLSQIFRWDLLVGERYGIKAAVRAERRRLDDESASASARRRFLLSSADPAAFDALSQEGQLLSSISLISLHVGPTSCFICGTLLRTTLRDRSCGWIQRSK